MQRTPVTKPLSAIKAGTVKKIVPKRVDESTSTSVSIDAQVPSIKEEPKVATPKERVSKRLLLKQGSQREVVDVQPIFDSDRINVDAEIAACSRDNSNTIFRAVKARDNQKRYLCMLEVTPTGDILVKRSGRYVNVTELRSGGVVSYNKSNNTVTIISRAWDQNSLDMIIKSAEIYKVDTENSVIWCYRLKNVNGKLSTVRRDGYDMTGKHHVCSSHGGYTDLYF